MYPLNYKILSFSKISHLANQFPNPFGSVPPSTPTVPHFFNTKLHIFFSLGAILKYMASHNCCWPGG